MKRLLILGLVAAVAVGGCSTSQPSSTGTRVSTVPGSQYRDVTLPAGTTLPLVLTSALDSGSNTIGDPVTAEFTRPVTVDGRDVLPVGTRVSGTVSDVEGAGRVTGRAMIAFRFTSLTVDERPYDVRTEPVSHLAAATKGEDAATVGIGAGAGAVIGGILGDTKGAVTGAAVGGGVGTGVVLATKGAEVELAPGADATTQLAGPVTVRVRVN
jgi:hypothetical protein